MTRREPGQSYAQVLTGITISILAGLLVPVFATKLQPLVDGFIKLIKMLLVPVIFATYLRAPW